MHVIFRKKYEIALFIYIHTRDSNSKEKIYKGSMGIPFSVCYNLKKKKRI